MTCYILDNRVLFEPLEGVDARHSELFHGMVDTNFPMEDNNEGDSLVHPLHLRKNVTGLAEIFKPTRNLIISENVAKSLGVFEHIGFLKVVFSCLFETGELGSWPVFRDYEELREWIATVSHTPSLEGRIANYYEMVIPRHSDAITKTPCDTTVTFSSQIYGNDVRLKLSTELLEKYPALWTGEGILLNSKLYHLIERYLDFRFFTLTPIVIEP